MYQYKYPRASMTADAVVFAWENERLYLLLIQRANEPFKGCWAFPGGFMDMDETVEQCAIRELQEETSMYVPALRQFHCFSGVDRDPRGRTLSVASMALVHKHAYQPVAGDDAGRAQWFALDELPPLAFDHQTVVDTAKKYLLTALDSTSVASTLLPESFTIEQYYRLCLKLSRCLSECDVIGSLECFKRRVTSLGIIVPSDSEQAVANAENDCACTNSNRLYSFSK